MNAAIYLRVSTKGQGEDDRLGLPTQRSKTEAYCRERGLAICETYLDKGFSGATADRPDLARMLEDAAAGKFKAVVLYKWDRLARDVMLNGYLRYKLSEWNVSLFSATETNGLDPTSKLTEQILASVAEYERHLIAQRLASARRLKAARGGYAHGQPPYGWRADSGKLAPVDAEQHILQLIRSLHDEGKLLREIAQVLNKQGLTPRSGRLWQTSSIASILNRKTRL